MVDKNTILKRQEEDLTTKGSELEGLAKTVSWVAEKADLQKTRADEKTEMQARYEELERANAGDIMRMTEAFNKEKEIAFASAAAEAMVARVESCKKTLRDFLRSPNYEAKVGCECAAYLTHLVTHCNDKLPKLVTLFASEKHIHPVWFEGLFVDAPPPPVNENEAANAEEEVDGEEDVALPGESRPSQPILSFIFLYLALCNDLLK
ncbi:hypothetical protein LIER_19077 [Lithospermum erythrorhizon]|uniref:Uncharacterized protein n=1 Tax=Lithospermum erythrorhizon TaxID=34254 RepID=A0AAV3QGB6_LITER